MKSIIVLLFFLLSFSCINKSEGIVKSVESNKESQISSDSIYTIVEEMPCFLACENRPLAEQKSCADQKMLEYLYKHIRYNPIAKENGMEGTIVVSFVVEKDGKLSNIEVLRGTGILNIIEVLEKMPSWKPGIHKGIVRRVRYNLPIKIHIE